MRDCFHFRTLLLSLACSVSFACTPKQTTGPTPSFSDVTANPLPPEEAEAMMGEVGKNFLYGQGVGDAAVAVGTTAAFPPFGLWWLGNAVLSLSGYEPIRVSDALPEEEGSWWRDAYDGLASGPGRFAAAIAGEEYRTEEAAQESLRPYLEQVKGQRKEGK